MHSHEEQEGDRDLGGDGHSSRHALATALLVEGVGTLAAGRRFLGWQGRILPGRYRWVGAAARAPESVLRLGGLVLVFAGVRLWRRSSAGAETEKVVVVTHVEAAPGDVWVPMAHLPFLAALPLTTMEVVGDPVNVGTVYRWTFRLPFGLMFRFDEVVTEWVEGERIAYRATSGWRMEARVTLTPEGSGTSLRVVLRYRLPGLWGLTPRWFVELGCRRGLANLRSLIESKAT